MVAVRTTQCRRCAVHKGAISVARLVRMTATMTNGISPAKSSTQSHEGCHASLLFHPMLGFGAAFHACVRQEAFGRFAKSQPYIRHRHISWDGKVRPPKIPQELGSRPPFISDRVH